MTVANAVAWKVPLPCPNCGYLTVIGYLLVNERGEHMHTRYLCTFWQSDVLTPGYTYHATYPCGWQGWTVPGWDRDDE